MAWHRINQIIVLSFLNSLCGSPRDHVQTSSIALLARKVSYSAFKHAIWCCHTLNLRTLLTPAAHRINPSSPRVDYKAFCGLDQPSFLPQLPSNPLLWLIVSQITCYHICQPSFKFFPLPEIPLPLPFLLPRSALLRVSHGITLGSC